MPHYVVPKPHSDSWRLVNDFSAGPYSLNSMVDRESVTGFPLDTLTHLGELLLRKLKEKPNGKLVVWKSDVSEAYRICPVHVLWQIKQAIRIQGELCIDCVNVFGGSPSGAIFISVNALSAWVARFVRFIENLIYVDDSFGVEEEGLMLWYAPYNAEFPAQQTRLLELWDELGIPHKLRKQIFGSRLTILGIDVDVDNLTFTLPAESKDRLSEELLAWSQKGVRKRVREWQQLAGWINWVFNVFPLLRPSLNNIYSKLKGKGQDSRVWANSAILDWAKWVVDRSDGVRLIRSLSWEVDKATCIIKTDACPEGLAFWYPDLNLGFYAPTPQGSLPCLIIFYEALAVLSALLDASARFPRGSRIVIYTDNSVTVSMFNSLKAQPEYNCILKSAVDILTDNHILLKILHIPGEVNDVADALSHSDFMCALRIHPSLAIHTFEPYRRISRHQLPPRLQPPRQSPLGASRC
jgi:hypothetical protein